MLKLSCEEEERHGGVLHGDFDQVGLLLERQRLLRWNVTWTSLSAAWFLSDSDPLASIDLRIAKLAAAELSPATEERRVSTRNGQLP